MTQHLIPARRRIAVVGGVVLSLAMLALPGATLAKSDATIKTGSCTAASDWKLKVKPDDGRLEVEFEVDQNRNGVQWRVVLKNDGAAFFRGQATTRAPSGSFSIERRSTNGPGSDKVVARATNPASGEVCRGTITILTTRAATRPTRCHALDAVAASAWSSGLHSPARSMGSAVALDAVGAFGWRGQHRAKLDRSRQRSYQ